VPLFIPPLRERRLDIELLLHDFIERNNARGLRQIRQVSAETMRALLDHRWPGNVRELQNVVEHAFVVGRGPQMTLEDLPPEFREPRSEPRPHLTAQDEAEAIRSALAESGGDVGRAAASLGMGRTTFWRKRKQHGL
jgi:DNA-binding NtrC family response regulator